jgi:hypothetical protein
MYLDRNLGPNAWIAPAFRAAAIHHHGIPPFGTYKRGLLRDVYTTWVWGKDFFVLSLTGMPGQ